MLSAVVVTQRYVDPAGASIRQAAECEGEGLGQWKQVSIFGNTSGGYCGRGAQSLLLVGGGAWRSCSTPPAWTHDHLVSKPRVPTEVELLQQTQMTNGHRERNTLMFKTERFLAEQTSVVIAVFLLLTHKWRPCLAK